jgi:hypothetical protein
MKYIKTHINNIMVGDTILYKGIEKTVSANNILEDKFLGRSIFGDSFNLGYIPVIKIIFPIYCQGKQIN